MKKIQANHVTDATNSTLVCTNVASAAHSNDSEHQLVLRCVVSRFIGASYSTNLQSDFGVTLEFFREYDSLTICSLYHMKEWEFGGDVKLVQRLYYLGGLMILSCMNIKLKILLYNNYLFDTYQKTDHH